MGKRSSADRDLDFKDRQRCTGIDFPEPVYAASLGQNFGFNTSDAALQLSIAGDPEFGVRLRHEHTPGDADERDRSTGVSTGRIQVRARFRNGDGRKIPISIVYRKGAKIDGTAPLLLYGYGSYGVSIPPTSPRTGCAARSGMVYVIAHVRGGGELGEPWRDAGRMMKKMNTFTDFIAAADTLNDKVHVEDRLVIQGGSAGGLLMGAVTNMRPDLVQGRRSPRCRSWTCLTHARCVAAADDQRVHRVGKPEREARVRLHGDSTRLTTMSRRRRIRRCW